MEQDEARGADVAGDVGVGRWLSGEKLYEATLIPGAGGRAIAVDSHDLALLPEYSSTLPTQTAMPDGSVAGVKRWKTWISGLGWHLGHYFPSKDGSAVVRPAPVKVMEIYAASVVGAIDNLRAEVAKGDLAPKVVDQYIGRVRAAVVALGEGQRAVLRELEETRRALAEVSEDEGTAEGVLAQHKLLREFMSARVARAQGEGTEEQHQVRELLAEVHGVVHRTNPPRVLIVTEYELIERALVSYLRRSARASGVQFEMRIEVKDPARFVEMVERYEHVDPRDAG